MHCFLFQKFQLRESSHLLATVHNNNNSNNNRTLQTLLTPCEEMSCFKQSTTQYRSCTRSFIRRTPRSPFYSSDPLWCTNNSGRSKGTHWARCCSVCRCIRLYNQCVPD